MKIITDCRVHLLTVPQLFEHPEYVLPPDGSTGERICAMGGKICYDTYGEDGNPVISHVRNLAAQLHFSVIEHVNVGLVISGISRGCSHEIVRHRHFSYSQRSTRYTAEEGAAIVLEPYIAGLYNAIQAADNRAFGELFIRPTEGEVMLVNDYLTSAQAALDSYSRIVAKLLDRATAMGMSARDGRKWARGKARQRLPHDLETRMLMTGNLRAWREFLIKRSSRHAEPEVRRLADKIAGIVMPIAPAAFHGLRGNVTDGYAEWSE